MYTIEMKHIHDDVFLSLSDEVKLKMSGNQIFVYSENFDVHQKMFLWLCENTNNVFHIKEESKDDGSRKCWIMFLDETDYMAFKIRWSEEND